MSKSISFPVVMCCNCDTEESTYICKQCKESDKYLCYNCSLLHPKIKAFKQHVLVKAVSSMSGSSSQTNREFFDPDIIRIKAKEIFFNGIRRLKFYVDYVYDILNNRDSIDTTTYYVTVSLCIIGFVLIYCLLKLLFGSTAVFVALGLVYVYHYAETKINEEAKEFLKQTTSQPTRQSNSNNNSKLDISNNNTKGLYKISQRKGFPIRPEAAASLPVYSENKPSINNMHVPESTEEFKDEFWHAMESKPAKFRPRGRVYKGRVYAEQPSSG